MLFYRCVLSLFPCEPYLRSASLRHGAVLDRRVIISANYLYFQSSAQNSVTKFKTQLVIKFNFQSFSFAFFVCDVLCVITLVMTPCNDPG
jgi:hypothetical protein